MGRLHGFCLLTFLCNGSAHHRLSLEAVDRKIHLHIDHYTYLYHTVQHANHSDDGC